MRFVLFDCFKAVPAISTVLVVRRDERNSLLGHHAAVLSQAFASEYFHSTLRTNPEWNIQMHVYMIGEITFRCFPSSAYVALRKYFY